LVDTVKAKTDGRALTLHCGVQWMEHLAAEFVMNDQQLRSYFLHDITQPYWELQGLCHDKLL